MLDIRNKNSSYNLLRNDYLGLQLPPLDYRNDFDETCSRYVGSLIDDQKAPDNDLSLIG